MPTDTDMRLRSQLDANQRDREQMCRAILALDQRYSEVRPRHPSGGRDGGRDIEAVFEGNRIAYGAVGFQNGANDSNEQKKTIRSKFNSDLKSAISAKADLKAFVFLTNLHFTVGEHDAMKKRARKAGIEHCDILDRERLRIELDSPAGFFVRFQYLGIPLSEAEQASFLSRYGDQIQQVVSTGFQRVERTLNRILFLQEASHILVSVAVVFKLNQTYSATDIGHFRAFVGLFLHEAKFDIVKIEFGASDKDGRFRTPFPADLTEPPGIAHGMSTGAWELHRHISPSDEDGIDFRRSLASGGGGVGLDPVSQIAIRYQHDDPLVRFRPRIQLRDLSEATFMPKLNLSLATKLDTVEVYANGYKLMHIGPNDFIIDDTDFETELSQSFTAEELSDRWVRLRPINASAFELRFDSTTPRRMFGHDEPSHHRQELRG